MQGVGVRKNAYDNMSPGQYQQVLAGLKVGTGAGKQGSKWRYISIPDNRKKPRPGGLKPGIYRVKTGEVQLLFTYARKQPQCLCCSTSRVWWRCSPASSCHRC
jgi:hypothetical protein